MKYLATIEIDVMVAERTEKDALLRLRTAARTLASVNIYHVLPLSGGLATNVREVEG